MKTIFPVVLITPLTSFVCVCVCLCSFSELFPGTSRLFPDQPIEGYDQHVEVLYDDRWGSICDSDWGTEDGTVVCNALVGSGTAQLVETPTFMQV